MRPITPTPILVVTAVLLYLLQRPFSNRHLRKKRRRTESEARSAQATALEPAFPTPPMPAKQLAAATKETADG